MNILEGIDITSSMLITGTTVPEPDTAAGEVAWVSAGTYAVLDRHVHAGSVYDCVQAHTGRTVAPADDKEYWKRMGPSNRMAPFDLYISTAAKATGSITYVMQPGFFTAVKVYIESGSNVSIEVRDAPGGTLLASMSADLWEQALGLYELLFGQLGTRESVELRGIPISPTAELRITVTSGPSAPVGIGAILVGEWVSLTGTGSGGTEFGAEAEPKSYSYIKFAEDGSFEILRRPGAINVSLTVDLDADQAQYAAALLRKVQDKPVAISASDIPDYGYLSTVGLVKGRVRAEKSKQAKAIINVQGTK